MTSRAFRAWLDDVKRLAVTEFGVSPDQAAEMDASDFMEFFERGYEPMEAFVEDCDTNW